MLMKYVKVDPPKYSEQGDVIHLDHWMSMNIVQRRGKKMTAMFVQEQATMTVQ